MLLAALTLIAAPGDHAHLHPADADFYISIPEVQELGDATDTVGMWRLIKDPEVLAFIGDMGFVREIVSNAIAEAEETARARAERPIKTALQDSISLKDSLKAIVACSLSISGLDEETEKLPFIVGSEGELIGFEDERGGELAAWIFQENEGVLIAEFTTPEEAQRAMALLAIITNELEATESLHETPVGALKVKDYRDPENNTRSLWVAKWGSHIAIGFGEAGAPSFLAALKEGESLASTGHWANGAAAMKEEGGTLLMTYHQNLIENPWYSRAILQSIMENDPNAPADPFTQRVEWEMYTGFALSFLETAFGGIVPMDASEEHGTCRIVDGEYVFETLVMGHAATGATPPLPGDCLDLVNPEAVGVWTTTLDTDGIARWGNQMIAMLTNTTVETVVAELEFTVGVSFEEFLAPFEEGIAFYMLPISGATVPRLHAVGKLEDPAAYAAAWTKLAEYLNAQEGALFKVEDRPYRKIPVFSLKQLDNSETSPDSTGTFSLGIMSPTPTVAILPDRAVFGISSSYVKREVRRLLKADNETTALHPLAENGAPCPAGANYFGHLDWPEVIGGLYDTITAFLPLIADADSMPFDIDALPETETITRHFSATNVWTRVEESGTYTLKRSPIGFDTGLVLLSGLIYGLAAGQGGLFGVGLDIGEPNAAATDPPTTTPPVADEADAGSDDATRKETQLTLQEVKLGLAIYKSEKGGFPGTLEELLAPTQTFPRGFLNSNTLPADGWGSPLRYSTQPEGAGYRLWSSGPDGIDDGGEGDDVPCP